MASANGMHNVGVLTSGGDAQGMNAAVRAAVRAGIRAGLEMYAICEGYRGMIEGGENIRRMSWEDVGGILQQGGTIIGSARSDEFRSRDGRRKAAFNLVVHRIDALVVIGGDGSLSGAQRFHDEWPELLAELVADGRLTAEQAARHPALAIAGLVGSIDNDMFGTDMTIGADTALHRIVDAVDAIASTAASHQRSFVVEVMGRHCGYLALMTSLACGANWVLLPEAPPEPGWEDVMCEKMRSGRKSGRRHNIVMVAEGATDRAGTPITSEYVRRALTERMGEEARVTILGHVQRGGTPSVFDRNMSTILGHAAIAELLRSGPGSEPKLLGLRGSQVAASPLADNVARTRSVATLLKEQRYAEAIALRGRAFVEGHSILNTLLGAQPQPPQPGQRQLRIAVFHADGPAPGMNTAARVAVRLGLDRGHIMLGIRNGTTGLLCGDVQELSWMSVHGWVNRGGAELGTSRKLPQNSDVAVIADQLTRHKIDGLLVIGGWAGYWLAYLLHSHQAAFPALRLPIVCVPATINHDLPGTEVTIGADTALNSIVYDVDKVRDSAVASRRCYVVEVMGRDSGYLALMGGMATGAEQVYMPEDGITLDKLRVDVAHLVEEFRNGQRLGLVVRSECADESYTTDFLVTLFAKESQGMFDVRRCVLGHTQQGGRPSPYDRIQATRLTARALDYLIEQSANDLAPAVCIGRRGGEIHFTSLAYLPDLVEPGARRPREQHWRSLAEIAAAVARCPRALRGDRPAATSE
jgi:6-phosphofructokinase 1